MSHSGNSSSGSSGNLGADEDSGSGSGTGAPLTPSCGRRFTGDTSFGRAGSPMPQLVQEFLQVEDRFRLQHEGPACSSDNLLLVYYNLENPIRAHPRSQSPPPSTPLEPAVAIRAQTEMRKFSKLAAQSCAWLSRTAASEEDVQTAYLSMMQALDELQGELRGLPFADKEWITTSSPPRIPSLLGSPASKDVPDTMADVTLCDEDDNVKAPSREESCVGAVEIDLSGALGVHPSAVPPFTPIFPLRTYRVPDDYDGLVVPTSDPREVEYPYMIVPSLETRLARFT